MVDVRSTSKVKVVPDGDPRWAACRAGDLAACNSLVEAHLPLLDQVAGSLQRKFPPHIEASELWSYGTFGLISAVRTYNPERAAFRTHAVLLIRGRIYDELRVQDWAPKTFRERVKEARRKEAEMTAENGGRPPTPEEVSLGLGKPANYVRSLRQEVRASYHKSLTEIEDSPTGCDGLASLATSADIVEVQHEAHGYMERLAQWTTTLTEQQQAVWALRYYKEMSPLAIGRQMGLRQSEVYAEMRAVLASFDNFVEKLKLG